MVDAWHLATYILSGIKRLGQLLGYGATSSLAGIPQQKSFDQHPGQSLEIYAGMLVEAGVLSRHGGMDDIGGKFLVCDECPVLNVECGKDLSVFRYDLGGEVAVRILQLPERRDVSEHPHNQDHQRDEQHRERDEDPEPLGYFLSCLLSHNKDKFITKFGKLPGLCFTLRNETSNIL